MAFDNTVRGLAKRIYNKITKIVDECKGQDDKYFIFGYFKYKDDKYSIEYNYINKELSITCNHSIMNFHMLVAKDGTVFATYYYGMDVLYDSRLRRIYKDIKLPEDKMSVKQAIDYQDSFPENIRRRIILLYEVVTRVLPNIEYDIEKTKSIDNLNEDLHNMMLDYQLKRLAIEGNGIPKSITIAVDWFVELIKNNKKNIIVTEKQIDIFRKELSNSLIEDMRMLQETEITPLYYGGYLFDLVDNPVEPKLDNALKKANISIDVIPYGTQMIVGMSLVKASKGNRVGLQSVYQSELGNVPIDDLITLKNDNQGVYEVIKSTNKYNKQLEDCVKKRLNGIN